MQAIVQIKGTQYLVSEGSEITVNRLPATTKSLNLDQILLCYDEKSLYMGKPYLSNCRIEADIIREEKGEKIRILKYKAKSHSRRSIGFRSQFHRLHINKIVLK